MPPGLISSAAPGKKATAPKAAPRRRAAAAAAAVPTGPPPSAAAVSSATTSVAPPTPEPTQVQAQTPAVEEGVSHEEEARPRESEVEAAKDATAPSETVAEDVPPLSTIVPAEAVESERETERIDAVDAVIPTPEPTQTETDQQSGVQEREEASPQAGADVASRRQALREELRDVEARGKARQEQLAVEARQAAEQEEASRNEANATPNVAHSASVPTTNTNEANAPYSSSYVPPSAASATPATIDPTTLPPPPRPVATPRPTSKRTRTDNTTTAASRPAKKAKTSSARSNAKVQAVVNEGDEGADGEESGVVSTTETDVAQPKTRQKRKAAPKKATTGRKRKEISQATVRDSYDEFEGQVDDEEEPEVEAAQRAPKKQRKPRAKRVTKKKPAKNPIQTGDGEAAADGEGEAGEENGEENEEEDDGSDPELHEIDPGQVSMWELSRDEYHGKKSERGKKMDDIDWDKVAQDRRDAANALVASFRTEVQPQAEPSGDVVPSVEDPTGTAEPEGSQSRRSQSRAATAAVVKPTSAPANDLGLGFVLDADGNIIADENTLTFTRDAAAQAAANSDAPVEEFTDLTQNINRFTHLNANRRDPADRLPVWKSKSDPWSEDETDKFYDALRMFGTDFFIISKMFAPKTRRMIKMKFNREEKLDPQRINRALTGVVETPMSLEHYSRETGFAMERFTKFDGVQHAQSVIDSENVGKEVVDEREAKRREKEVAKEEKEREKEREKEERKAKRKAKTKKGIAEAGGVGFGGGGPVEDVVAEAE